MARAFGRRSLPLLAVIVLAVVPSGPAAEAASVGFDATTLSVSYVADPGETNNLTVDQSAGEFTFTDSGTGGVQITDGDGLTGPCSVDPMTPNVATCPTAGVDLLIISTGDGDDIVVSNAALPNPVLIDGGTGDDQLAGGPGADMLTGGLGDDTLTGGGGSNDTAGYAEASGPVTVSLATSAAQDTRAAGSDTITQVENLTGSAQGDTLSGDGGNNLLSGGAGDDALSGAGGDDTLDGGSGNGDRASYADAGSAVTVDLSEAGAQDTGGAGSDAISGVENLTGSAQGDRLSGDGGANSLDGGAGDDTLAGGPGADTMAGGPGSDTVDYHARAENLRVTLDAVADDGAAGEGDNVMPDVATVIGGAGSDQLAGNEKENGLEGGPGDDTLDGGEGADLLAGGPGFDSANYAGRTASVSINLAAPGHDGEVGESDVTTGVEKAVGGGGNDRLTGDDLGNVLDAGAGNDLLEGRAGADLLIGGPGNDVSSGDTGDDTVDGGGGGDVIHGGAGNDLASGGPGDDILDGGLGADKIGGGGGSDTVDYSSRTRRVDVRLDGKPDDGEAAEVDHVQGDVHNVKTGGGRDFIDSRDGVKGRVACGGGTDVVRADRADLVAPDCEQVNGLSATGRCRTMQRSATMNRRGIVAVRVRCALANAGVLALEGHVVRAAKRKGPRTVKLGRKVFSFRSARAGTVKVKLSRKGRRAVLDARRRLRARTIITTRHTGAEPSSITRSLILKASNRRR